MTCPNCGKTQDVSTALSNYAQRSYLRSEETKNQEQKAEIQNKTDKTYVSQVQEYGAICEICNRFFSVTTSLPTENTVTCPYCEHVQNIQPALNRYTYALQQQQQAQANQQALATQQALSNWAQQMRDIQRRHDEAEQRNIQTFQQNIHDWNQNWRNTHNRPGSSRFNPLYIESTDR